MIKKWIDNRECTMDLVFFLFLAGFTQTGPGFKRHKISSWTENCVHSGPLSVYILDYVFVIGSNLRYHA